MIYIGNVLYSGATAKERMGLVCKQVKAGATFMQLVAFSQEHGLDRPGIAPDGSVSVLEEFGSMGRASCVIKLEAGVVVSSTYAHMD